MRCRPARRGSRASKPGGATLWVRGEAGEVGRAGVLLRESAGPGAHARSAPGPSGARRLLRPSGSPSALWAEGGACVGEAAAYRLFSVCLSTSQLPSRHSFCPGLGCRALGNRLAALTEAGAPGGELHQPSGERGNGGGTVPRRWFSITSPAVACEQAPANRHFFFFCLSWSCQLLVFSLW